MKLLILIAAQLFTLSAMAMTITVEKSTSNGTVAPAYQLNTNCIIGNIVESTTTGPSIQFPHTSLVQVQYTHDVPNQAVMESLVGDAARAPVQSNPGPIGGPTVSYVAHIDAGQAILLVRSGQTVIRQNHSAAALKLQKLIDQNCH
jgi:hypothetical protein